MKNNINKSIIKKLLHEVFIQMRLMYIKGETKRPITFSPNKILGVLSKDRKDLLLSFPENLFKLNTK